MGHRKNFLMMFGEPYLEPSTKSQDLRSLSLVSISIKRLLTCLLQVSLLSFLQVCYLVGGFNSSQKYESVGMMNFPKYGKVKHVPNHQPVTVWYWFFMGFPCFTPDDPQQAGQEQPLPSRFRLCHDAVVSSPRKCRKSPEQTMKRKWTWVL